MIHEFNYRTEFGGLVCTCQRYFDFQEDLQEHISDKIEEN